MAMPAYAALMPCRHCNNSTHYHIDIDMLRRELRHAAVIEQCYDWR